ncbi:17503_t:CDS:2, partial [Funneliformis geosporum]
AEFFGWNATRWERPDRLGATKNQRSKKAKYMQGTRLCREIVSKYLGPPSKIRQPDFLKTPKHPSGLHLDIYYPQYSLAIEVQGKQHKHYIEHFHRTLEGFNNLLARDQLKKELCEENQIVL